MYRFLGLQLQTLVCITVLLVAFSGCSGSTSVDGDIDSDQESSSDGDLYLNGDIDTIDTNQDGDTSDNDGHMNCSNKEKNCSGDWVVECIDSTMTKVLDCSISGETCVGGECVLTTNGDQDHDQDEDEDEDEDIEKSDVETDKELETEIEIDGGIEQEQEQEIEKEIEQEKEVEQDACECTFGPCCSDGCNFNQDGTACGDTASECVNQDTCNDSGVCIDNGFAAASTACGDDDQCDESGLCVDCTDVRGCSDFVEDSNACTSLSCESEVCTELNDNSNICDDGIGCTATDSCRDGVCVPAAGCYIDGACYTDGVTKGDSGSDVCLVCDNANDPFSWSGTVTVSCDDGIGCTANDYCRDGECVQESGCYIYGECRSEGDRLIYPASGDYPGSTQCMICENASDASGWTAMNSGSCDDALSCTDNDTCVAGECTGDLISGCLIEDFAKIKSCYVDGELKKVMGIETCEVCDPGTNPYGWTPLDSVSCDDNDPCTTNDVCTNGVCSGEGTACSEHEYCNGAGSCECLDSYTGENCDECVPGAISIPGPVGEPPLCFLIPAGYCDGRQCGPVSPTNQVSCYSWDDPFGIIECPGTAGSAECSDIANKGCGQDAQYPAMRTFTCYNNLQQEVACGDSIFGVAKDSFTGLYWNKWNKGYTNYTRAAEICEEFNDGDGYYGYDDWRLPTIIELISLADYGDQQTALDNVPFGSTNARFWSTTTGSGATTEYWSVSAMNGDTRLGYDSANIRCVRGSWEGMPANGTLPRSDTTGTPFFTVEEVVGEPVIKDVLTGLVWLPNTDQINPWTNILSYCEGLDYGGYNNWRVPDVKEMVSIVDHQLANTNNEPDPVPGFPHNGENTWFATSTTNTFFNIGYPEIVAGSRDYMLYLPSGTIISHAKDDDGCPHIMCVTDNN